MMTDGLSRLEPISSVPVTDDRSRLPHESLRRLADAAGVRFGAAVDVACIADRAYRAALAKHFSMVEPENALKWAALRPSRDAFDFSGANAIVEIARASGQVVRGHVLAWHAYNPSWLRRGRFEPRELSRLLQEHVETVVGRFDGAIVAWDVVNEAVDDATTHGMRASLWYNRPGIGFAGQGGRYVGQIFRWARAAAPDARLFYNDDPAATPSRGRAMLRLLTELRERDVPVDGVGLQLHLELSTDLPRLEDSLAQFGDLGLELQITELDVAIPSDAQRRPLDPRDLERQAEVYGRVVGAALGLARCTAIQTWGVDDGHSWIPEFSRGAFGSALLLDDWYRPKPAYHAVASALQRAAAARTVEQAQ